MNIKSIRMNVIITVTLLTTISFFFLAMFNYRVNRRLVEEELLNSTIPLLRDNIYSEIERSFLPALGTASVMSKDTFLQNWVLEAEDDTTQITEYLSRIKEEFNYITTFFVSVKTGNYYTYSGFHKTVSKTDEHDAWYYTFIDTGHEYDLDVDLDEAHDNRRTIFINYRVESDEGQLIGVTGVGIEMNLFSNFLQDTQKRYQRNIYLTDDRGVIQAHSNNSVIEVYTVDTSLLFKSVNPTNIKLKRDRNNVLISTKYIPDINWFLIVEQNEESSLSMINDNLTRTVVTGIVLLIAMVLTIFLVLKIFTGRMEQLAITDELTGAYNRREFNRWLERSLDKKSRKGTQVSLISIDIDHFKDINDNNGHLYGDKILRELSEFILRQIRPSDIYCRLGGDEFIIVMEANLEEALLLANRLKRDLNSSDIDVRLSIGVYEIMDSDSFEDAINNTDKALYRAKESGRDRISTHKE